MIKSFLKKCVKARDYLLGIHMIRCIWDIVWISWLFLCFLVTAYAMFIGIIEFIGGRTGFGPVLAVMVMFTCSGFLLRNILVTHKDSTL